MDDGCVEIAAIIFICIMMIFVLAFGVMYPINYFQCEKLQKLNPEFEFQNDWFLGCMVYLDGMWIDADNVRGLTQ